MSNQRILEIFFIQCIAYFCLWLYNSYFGFMLSIIFGCIAAAILLISLVSEWIESSRVPRWYFKVIGISVLAPLASYMLYISIFGSTMSWLQKG